MHDACGWWAGGRGEGGAGAAQHAADRGVLQHRHSRQQRAHASQHLPAIRVSIGGLII